MSLLLPSFIDKPPAPSSGRTTTTPRPSATPGASTPPSSRRTPPSRPPSKTGRPARSAKSTSRPRISATSFGRQSNARTKARQRLAQEIHRHRDSLIDGIDFDQRHQECQRLIAQLAERLDALTLEVGGVRNELNGHAGEDRCAWLRADPPDRPASHRDTGGSPGRAALSGPRALRPRCRAAEPDRRRTGAAEGRSMTLGTEPRRPQPRRPRLRRAPCRASQEAFFGW